MDIARRHDVKVIEKGLKSVNPIERKQAKKAADKISKEDGWTKSARAELIKETLQGRKDNCTQIREDMVKHEGRKTGGGSRSVTFNWPEGVWEQIYGHK